MGDYRPNGQIRCTKRNRFRVTCRQGSTVDPVSPPRTDNHRLRVHQFAAALLVVAFFLGTVIAGSVAFQPGVVIDETRNRAYVMGFDGGVDAVDLIMGGTIWSVPINAKPLGMHGSLLVVQQEVLGDDHLNVAFLEVDNAGDMVLTSRMPLPAKVKPLIAERLGERFSAHTITRSDELFITWQYQMRPRSGSHGGSREAIQSVKTTTGAFGIDLETGFAIVLEDYSILEPSPLVLPSGMNQPVHAGETRLAPSKAGNVFFAHHPTHRDPAGRRTVQRWRAEDGQQLTDLTISDPLMSFKLVSSNSPHYLASGVLEQDSQLWARFTWNVYNLETGAMVGQSRSHIAAAPFFITGNLIIHELQPSGHLDGDKYLEAPRRLVAVSLEDGLELWNRPLRDLRYHGVMPPGRGGEAPSSRKRGKTDTTKRDEKREGEQ